MQGRRTQHRRPVVCPPVDGKAGGLGVEPRTWMWRSTPGHQTASHISICCGPDDYCGCDTVLHDLDILLDGLGV